MRDLLIAYGVSKQSKILDPCGGWGGRVIGASVVAGEYHAFEPATQTYKGLTLLAEYLASFKTGFIVELTCLPFEDAKLPIGAYDIAITSPPYFDTEQYSNEPTDSATRYKTFESWLCGFFYPMLHKTMLALKPNRPFILNIGSRVYPLSSKLVNWCTANHIHHKKIATRLSGIGGLGKSGEGEVFYELTLKN